MGTSQCQEFMSHGVGSENRWGPVPSWEPDAGALGDALH